MPSFQGHLFKAIANRAKDQIDLLGLVRLENVNWAYVDEQARGWGVEAVIARIRALVSIFVMIF